MTIKTIVMKIFKGFFKDVDSIKEMQTAHDIEVYCLREECIYWRERFEECSMELHTLRQKYDGLLDEVYPID